MTGTDQDWIKDASHNIRLMSQICGATSGHSVKLQPEAGTEKF
jgi:hypothetical protein